MAQPGFYISIVTYGRTTRAEVAQTIRGALTADGAIQVPLRWEHGDDQRKAYAKSTGEYSHYVELISDEFDNIELTVERWKRADDTEPERVGWRVRRGEYAQLNVRKLLQKFLHTENHLRVLKEVALSYGARVSERVSVNSSGDYVDKLSAQVVSFDEAFNIYLDEKPLHRNWVRMVLEAGTFFGIEMFFYWTLMRDANVIDWDYSLDLRALRERWFSFKGWWLDDNNYNTNARNHPFQGSLNYLFARTNNFTTLESFLISFTLSTAWELIGEFKEQVSINDMIVTPVAGYAIGETFAQLGAFFARGRPTIWNKMLANVLGGTRGIHDYFDRSRPKRSLDVTALGFDETVWHDFKAYIAGGAQTGKNGADTTVVETGLETEILTIPDFDKPGEVNKLLTDGNFTRLVVKSSWGEQGLVDFTFLTRAALVAYYRKRIDFESRNGYNLIVGLSSAYEYNMHRSQDGHDTELTKDRIAVVHVVGPTLDLTWYYKGLRLRAVVDVYGDFAILRSYAFDEVKDKYRGNQLLSTIVHENYYHALGLTAQGRLVANYGRLEAGVELELNWFDSIDTLDRHQADLEEQATFVDGRRKAKIWTSFRIGLLRGVTVDVGAKYESRKRSGWVDDTHFKGETEHRYMGIGALRF